MNQTVQRLLTPISAEQPCGPDPSYDPQYDALIGMARGKPEVEIGSIVRPAEPPDWRALQQESSGFLEKKSKHLTVAVIYACAHLKLAGVEGLRDGLELIHGLVKGSWPAVYPLLDPEDNNDPTQRLNILRTLTSPRGSVDGWLRYLDYVYEAEFCRPKGQAPVTFDMLMQSRAKAAGAPDESKLSALIMANGMTQLENCRRMLQESLTAVDEIDQFLTETLGSAGSMSFENLRTSLKELLALIKGFVAPESAEAASLGEAAGAGDGPAAAITVRGSVRSRQDVVAALEQICSYYRQVEPNSPVPYLLRRAQKMVHMNFVEVMQELNLATPDVLRPSLGVLPESAPPA